MNRNYAEVTNQGNITCFTQDIQRDNLLFKNTLFISTDEKEEPVIFRKKWSDRKVFTVIVNVLPTLSNAHFPGLLS